jgi:hypothetical protein
MTAFRSAIALGLFAAVLAAACQPEGRIFEITLNTEFNHPLPVTLTDETTLVTGIAQAAVDPSTTGNEPAVEADPGDPNGLVLTWLGGECDQDAALRFQVLNGGYVLNLATHGKLGLGGCPATGVPRAVRIMASRPIPFDSITVAGG